MPRHHSDPGPGTRRDSPEPRFPTVRWGDETVTFERGPAPRAAASAVIAFAWHDGGFVLADIPGRGLCTPSGRVEPDETAARAARRETAEEIGGRLRGMRRIGHYVLRSDDGAMRLVPAFAGRVEAFGSIPAGSESRGARWVAPGDLPKLYYRWDPLLAAVFALAERELGGAAPDRRSRERPEKARPDGGRRVR